MISLLAHGLCSPLGPSDIAAAALRAGLSRAERFAPAPVLGCGEDAAPAACQAVLPPGTSDRRAALLRLAWEELLLGPVQPAERLLLCLPLPDPLRWGPDGPPDAAAAAHDLCGVQQVECLPLGQAAAAAAVLRASELIATRSCRRVLIAAVDSLLDPASLAWLAETGRLRGPETPDGVVPGEGAAWWLVAAADPAAMACLAAGHAASDGRRAPQDDADRLLQAGRGLDGAAWHDGDGEMWRARALGRCGLAEGRQPADGWGCLGACSALAAGCVAAQERPAVLWSLSDDGAAGAIRLG